MWRNLRDKIGAPIISTWIDEAGAGETSDWPGLAIRCLEEASSCRVLILLDESPGDRNPLSGALMEVGAALAAGAWVVMVAKPDHRHRLLKGHPKVMRVDTNFDALEVALLIIGGANPRLQQTETQ